MSEQPTQGPQTGQPNKPSLDDLYAGRFTSAASWIGGNREVTIISVGAEWMRGLDGKGGQQAKVTIEVEGVKRPIVLNKTNFDRISKAYGRDYNTWVARKLFVAVVEKDVAGRLVNGYTLSPVQP